MHGRSYNPSRRSRGSRGMSFTNNQGRPYEKKEPSEAQLMKGLGDEVETVPVPSSETGYSSPVSIENFEAVASYSWLDSRDSIILVPGSPPVWRERALPYMVPRDSGTVFVDQNASRLSASPLLPLIAAVSHYAPSFSLGSVNFVTDRNGLRKLWRWAIGDASAGTFRIDTQLVGTKTVLMQRWETETTQQGGPGYEREFEKASTRPGAGCERATGHHRIVTYDLGGLKMLVRFKADACLPSQTKTNSEEQKDDALDELTSGLQKLSVEKISVEDSYRAVTKVPAFNGASLSIHTRGTLVPQADLLELKTRSERSVDQFDWDETYPQLLLSKTPNMFLCVHQRGHFYDVRKRTLAELETEAVARKAQDGLRQLRKVLGGIQDILREEGEGARLSLVCQSGAEMVVYERKGKDGCLPGEVLKSFKD